MTLFKFLNFNIHLQMIFSFLPFSIVHFIFIFLIVNKNVNMKNCNNQIWCHFFFMLKHAILNDTICRGENCKTSNHRQYQTRSCEFLNTFPLSNVILVFWWFTNLSFRPCGAMKSGSTLGLYFLVLNKVQVSNHIEWSFGPRIGTVFQRCQLTWKNFHTNWPQTVGLCFLNF